MLARMRGATRTVEELKTFFKERALIEEDYAKRMAKLSKQALGRDEIGEMRACIDSLKAETDKQASFHQLLAQQMRTDMENVVNEFHTKQQQFKKITQATIERQHKAKQVQENYVQKAKEKYEFDCQKINSYTAQSSLVQGKELEKVQVKLQRAEQTVQANERDFASFTKALAETTAKWELDWRAFCDKCQDMEETRMDFLKDVMWAYANSVSTVCVSDDESCERLRLSLEQLETPRDMENFVNRYGTGAMIPYPPQFVSYTDSENGRPSSSQLPPDRMAQFVRISNRPRPEPLDDYQHGQQQPEPEPQDLHENNAGLGANGLGAAAEPADQPQVPAASANPNRPSTIRTNGMTPVQATRAPSAAAPAPIPSPTKPTTPAGGLSKPPTGVELIIGNHSYPVDPNRDPQVPGPSRSPVPPRSGPGDDDPLAKHMANLMISCTGRPGLSSAPKALSPPGVSSPPASHQRHDYHKSAEDVVGGVLPRSRPVSPAPMAVPPSPVMMRPRSVNGHAEGVPDHEQKFPGEVRPRRSFIAPSPAGSGQQSQNQNGHGQISGLNRSPSQNGFAGIGTHSRSNSPQPGQPPQHYQPPQQFNQPLYQQPQHPQQPPQRHRPNTSNGFIQPPTCVLLRSASPNITGINLDPFGRVNYDEMAIQQDRQQQQPPRGVSPGGAPPMSAQPQMAPHGHPNATRGGSFIGSSPVGSLNGHPAQSPHQHTSNPSATINKATQQAHNGSVSGTWVRGPSPAPQAQPPPQQQYNPTGYAPSPSGQQGYPQQGYPAPSHQQHPSQGSYGHGHTPSYGNNSGQMVLSQHPTGYSAPQYVASQPTGPAAHPPNNALVRGPSASAGGGAYYGAQPGHKQQPYGHPAQQGGQHYGPPQGHGQQQIGGRGPYGRPPSPQPPAAPTGQTTEDGMGILFYVKALYDYHASTDQEFDFQAGDIIAVTETPEDGWWSGELLDEARRQRGRTVFPSNFVCLLE